MPPATHLTLQLARFDAPVAARPVRLAPSADLLCGNLGADTRAAGTEPASMEAFSFVVVGYHPDEVAAQRFLDDRRAVAPWLGEAREVWGAVLQPFRHHGEANHLNRAAPGPLFETMAPAPGDDEPIVVTTSSGWQTGAGFDPERVRQFSAGVAAVRIGMTAVPGLQSQQSFFFPGVLECDPMTVTTWQSFAAMRAWAYGTGVHRMHLDRHRAAAMSDRTSFTRSRIVRSVGTWYGQTPAEWCVGNGARSGR